MGSKSRSKAKSRLTAASFFSGAMGMDLGLEQAGIEIVLACENDPACVKTIQLNKPRLPLLGDIEMLDAVTIRRVLKRNGVDRPDLIVGGPPCQAFSTAGRRRGFHDQRGNVFLHFLDIVCELRPRFLVIENVRGLLSAPLAHRPHREREPGRPLEASELPGGAMREILGRLHRAGYAVSFNLYNAANFGAAQCRERVVIIGHLGDKKVPHLVPTHSQSGEAGLPKWRTFRQATEGLGPEQHFVAFSERRLSFYRLLKPGQNWRNLPPELWAEAMGKSLNAGGGKTGFYRRLAWDKPSPTLVTHPAMPATDLAHPVEDRPLSVEEYKRLQGFPESWRLSGSIIEQYRQLGNAVPIPLGHAVGRAIVAVASGSPELPPLGFRFSRYDGTDEATWKPGTPTRDRKQLALALTP